MINLPVLPILIPLLAGTVLMFFRTQVKIQRIISTIASLATIGAAIALINKVSKDGIQTVNLSN